MIATAQNARTVGDLMLADIIASRHDDGPRLIYADWLADCGQSERGDLIRLQCEESRLRRVLMDHHPYADCSPLSASWCPVCGDCVCRSPEDRMDDAACPLHAPTSRHGGDESIISVLDDAIKQSRHLLDSMVLCADEHGRMSNTYAMYAWVPPRLRRHNANCWTWERGFVDSVHFRLADMRECLPVLVAQHPVAHAHLCDVVRNGLVFRGSGHGDIPPDLWSTLGLDAHECREGTCVGGPNGTGMRPRGCWERGTHAYFGSVVDAERRLSELVLAWARSS